MKSSRRTTLSKVGQQQNLQLRSKIRSYMPEAREMTVWQKHALQELIFEKGFKPVIHGEVDIREVFTPPGGWV